jgi:Family of unknown function (DUF6011)
MRIGSYNYGTHEAFDTHGVLLGTFSDSKEAEKAMWAARLPHTFWHPEQIPPIPLLQELNDWVISQNEKRLPRWKFRFAFDLGMQIQSRITRAHVILFECFALQTENVSVELLTEPKLLRERHHWRIKFELFRDEPNAAWQLKPKSAGRGQLCPMQGLLDLRQRIRDVLHPDHFAHLKPDLMLSPYCLCCGKGLTDPASMARWIGPECWGNGSVSIPHMFRAESSE